MKPKKGDAGYIPRPPNAFILFRKEFMKHRDPELLRQDQKGKSIVTGKAWKALSREDRAVWDSLAEEVKRAHAVMYPGYRYRPTPRTMPKMKRNTHQVPGIDNVYEAMADAITLAKDEDEVLRLGEKAKELRVAHVCNEGSSHGGFKTVFRSKPAGSSPAQTDAPALRNSPLPVQRIPPSRRTKAPKATGTPLRPHPRTHIHMLRFL
ncbi:hypothetical protein CERSUDRAFT_61596 [Gelatoporia subvermispora B]|uniref:HMG box domain-containing protein n=1 Tax=Ceriporiopsis subvermispora (strain B) TaxID=914234 RepID=M2RRT2_CERS8|nr:hypothetical protein CERSUDRAFT_61596 [Gelatoporia subvermispora B]